MPTVSAKVNKKELDAINEYANACGETVSNVVRKSVIRRATMMDGFHDSNDYECEISVPENVSSEEETGIVQGAYNKIRRILGLEEIEL